jgi:hypothetical protein
MNGEHLRAFAWLRWRLLINQWRRAGAVNAVLMTIVAVGALATAVPLFVGCFIVGLYAIPHATPAHLLYAWDAVVVAFLFFWGVGLVTELQRSEPLALSKFLHLPVSPSSAFLINYLSSFLRLSLIVFGPVMLAFACALVAVKGIRLLPVLPLLAAFLLMVTALTHQVQGWLAAMMDNPRRRRAVVMGVTAAFVLLAQLPNLVNFVGPWGPGKRGDRAAAVAQELGEVQRAFDAHEIDAAEMSRRQQEIMRSHKLFDQKATQQTIRTAERVAGLVNTVLPVGWLPLGVMTAAQGQVIPALLCLLGMSAIGGASLWRSYRTTIGLYQGRFTSGRGKARAPAPAPAPVPAGARRRLLLEAQLPGLSEPVAAIALAALRSLARSPEAKMMLLTPLIMCAVFGSMLFRARGNTPESVRPLVASGAMFLVLFGVMQLMANQFGFDRDGFRVFVLSAARRRDILLGKNLGFAPLALGLALFLLVLVQIVCPLRIDHLLAMFPQYVSMFLLFCLVMNLLSIIAPVYVAAGSLKPSNMNLTTALLQFVVIAVLFPLTQAPVLLPLGIETVLQFFGRDAGVPICLLLSLAECAVVVLVYHFALAGLGSLLQAREQKILETVTSRPA